MNTATCTISTRLNLSLRVFQPAGVKPVCPAAPALLSMTAPKTRYSDTVIAANGRHLMLEEKRKT